MTAVQAFWEKRLDARFLLGATLAAVVIGWGLMQIRKNDYGSALALPAAIVAIILLLAAAPPKLWMDRLLDRLAILLVVISCASQAALFVHYWRPL